MFAAEKEKYFSMIAAMRILEMTPKTKNGRQSELGRQIR